MLQRKRFANLIRLVPFFLLPSFPWLARLLLHPLSCIPRGFSISSTPATVPSLLPPPPPSLHPPPAPLSLSLLSVNLTQRLSSFLMALTIGYEPNERHRVVQRCSTRLWNPRAYRQIDVPALADWVDAQRGTTKHAIPNAAASTPEGPRC
jgi:hypothetical protein